MTPPFWWYDLDWKWIVTSAFGVSGFAYPYFREYVKDRKAGRATEQTSLVKAAESAAERVDRINKEEYERLRQDRDYWMDLAQDARGMEDWAHFYRHGWLGVVQRWQAVVDLTLQIMDGKFPPERVQAIVDSMRDRSTGPALPPPVPRLEDARERKPPGE